MGTDTIMFMGTKKEAQTKKNITNYKSICHEK